jgi:outer membrane lipoprotein SlyB
MKPTLPLVAVLAGVTLASCTFPSSRNTVPRSQSGVLQNVDTGVVTSVRTVNIEGQRTNLGMYGGGIVGGASASGIGKGVGSSIATAVGAVGGAVVGQAVEEAATRKVAQEISVRLDDGRSVVVTQEVQSGMFQDGDRVRIMNSHGEARVAMATH